MDADLSQQHILALTGATGFLGGRTLSMAVEQGYAVRALTRREQPEQHGVTWVRGALDNSAALLELCTGADTILHIAGVVNAPDRKGFADGNIAGTANMLAAAKEAGAGHFIHVSSLAAKQPELSIYGWSKAEGEALVRKSDLPWSIIRPPGIYGPGDTEFLDMFRLAQKGLALLPPKGRVSMVHADDMARLLLTMAVHKPVGSMWEADDGHRDGAAHGWDHRDFAQAIGKAVGRAKLLSFNAPATMLKAAAYGDKLVRRAKAKLTPDRARYLSYPDWTVDPACLPPADIWRPHIDTEKGLVATAQWYREKGWLQ